MRELTLRVRAEQAEDVLDVLLPVLARGVLSQPEGELVALRLRGDDGELPPAAEIAAALGGVWHSLEERVVPDDWRDRRLADYRPDPIGGSLVIRPDWAPAMAAARGWIDVVLASGSAFGSGRHPTTRTCVELLLGLEVRGSFADLGCGTGVLAIVAAKLGFAPVHAVDVRPSSIEQARANVRANGVPVDLRVADLGAEPPPAADVVAANVPVSLHERIAASSALPPGTLIASGFGPADAADVRQMYERCGLAARQQFAAAGWAVLLLERD